MSFLQTASTIPFSTHSYGENGDLSDADESPASLKCPVCYAQHANFQELLQHQTRNKHHACDECEHRYTTREALLLHKHNQHPAFQDLKCLGCHARFIRISHYWHHIENNDCTVIKPCDVHKQRERKLEFAKQLGLRTVGLDEILHGGKTHIKRKDTWAADFPAAVPIAEPMPAADFGQSGGPLAHPALYRIDDFPEAPSGRIRSREGSSPFVQRLSQPFPGAVSGPLPRWKWTWVIHPDGRTTLISCKPVKSSVSATMIQTMATPPNAEERGQNTTISTGLIMDPNETGFDASMFMNKHLGQYVCPHKSCFKKFNTSNGLVSHLGSPAHAGGHITCVCCRKTFNTTVNLIEHIETTKNCTIRQCDEFRRVLGDITGGLIDVDTRSKLKNGTTKYLISEKAFLELINSKSGSVPDKKGEEYKVRHAPAPNNQGKEDKVNHAPVPDKQGKLNNVDRAAIHNEWEVIQVPASVTVNDWEVVYAPADNDLSTDFNL